jgi:hypothetical protein
MNMVFIGIIIIIIIPTMGFAVDVWAFEMITIYVDLIIHDWGGELLHAYGYNQLLNYFFQGDHQIPQVTIGNFLRDSIPPFWRD